LDKALEVILVGYGRAGSIHAKAHTGLSKSCRLVGIVDNYQERHDVVEKEHADTGIFETIEQAISCVGNDVVVDLCVPASQYFALVESSIHLGVNRFILEKPLGWSFSMSTALNELLLGVDAIYLDTYQFSTGVKMLFDWASQQSGCIQKMHIKFNKNRLSDSSVGRGFDQDVYPDAWHIEGPHMVSISLKIAGDISVIEESSLQDMENDFSLFPNHGGAQAIVRHESGVKTFFSMDLCSLVSERTVEISMDNGIVLKLKLPSSRATQQMSHIHKVVTGEITESISIEDRPMEQAVCHSINYFLLLEKNVPKIGYGLKISSILQELVTRSLSNQELSYNCVS